MPILLLTERAETGEGSPAPTLELLERIEALLRHSRMDPAAMLVDCRFGDVFVDFYRGRATKRDRPVELTAKELLLLRYLVARRGAAVSRPELLQEVWGYHSTNTRTVDVHVATLRQKLEDNPHEPAHILTLRGEGYQFQSARS